MKKIFEKHETIICIFLIALYVIINSFCINNFGVADYRSALINTAFSVALLVLTAELGKTSCYGLRKAENLRDLLYFIPLGFIVSVNLWTGINITNSTTEILFHVITMVNVGFIEEIIFRGYLFKMMEKDNRKTAVIVSSVTFGLGHIINLLNGAELVATLLQICYAISVGYLFVVIFIKSKSIIPCIIAHSLNNALSIFSEETTVTQYLVPLVLIIVPFVYAVYINKKIKE